MGTRIKINGGKFKRADSGKINNPTTTSKQMTSLSKLYSANFADFSRSKKRLISAVAYKAVQSGSFTENVHKQACVNKPRLEFEQQHMRTELPFLLKPANWSYLEKISYISTSLQLFSCYCWVDQGQEDTMTLQQLSVRPFFLSPASSGYLLLCTVARQGSP